MMVISQMTEDKMAWKFQTEAVVIAIVSYNTLSKLRKWMSWIWKHRPCHFVWNELQTREPKNNNH